MFGRCFSSGVLRKEDWALPLAVGGVRVRGASEVTVEVYICGGDGCRIRWKSRRKSETAGTLS